MLGLTLNSAEGSGRQVCGPEKLAVADEVSTNVAVGWFSNAGKPAMACYADFTNGAGWRNWPRPDSRQS